MDRICAALGPGQKLIEPFVGSGAVFLNTDYKRYLLADSNPDLIALYEDLRAGGTEFIETCAALFAPENNDSTRYYLLRQEFNQTADRQRKSALFLYLNRHGYNGLCRYNASGQFNTPFGQITKPYFPRKEMRHFLTHARRASFRQEGFRHSTQRARRGDIVYCDPPYVPLSRTASFTDYHTGGFDWDSQVMLAETAARLASRGVRVVISNHDTREIRKLYREHQGRIQSLQVRRSISCNGAARDTVGEIIAVFGMEESVQ